MASHQGPTGQHGRPLSDLWLHPVLPYGIAYSFAVFVNSEAAREFLAPVLGIRLTGFIIYPPLTCLAGTEPFLISWCLPRLRRRWERAIEAGTLGPAPSWALVGIGVVTGCAVGLLLAGVEMVLRDPLRTAGLLVLSVVGPLPGMGWIVA